MESLLQALTEWLKEMLVDGIMEHLTNAFSSVNEQVAQIASGVGQTPGAFLPGVSSMIRTVSESVILPVAGIIFTFVACYELIQLVISHNNLANLETWIFFKWIFKTTIAIYLISNTFPITMAVFDVAQWGVQQSGGFLQGSTAIDDSALQAMEGTLLTMEVPALLTIYLQSFVVQFCIYVLSVVIFIIINGRMVEIYLVTSLAPIPFATFASKEQGSMGQHYIKSLFALGFQGFLMMICVGIYAVLITDVTFTTDLIGSLWQVLGFTALLAFTLFKTGAVARSVLQAH